MNTEQQRIRIAEACGYVWDNGRIGVCGWWTDPSGLQVSWGQNKLEAMSQLLMIDYLNDLNAMHEAEKTLFPKHEAKWAMTMSEVCGHSWRIIYTATAAQRAEAFLKTLGLWEEES